MKKLRWTGLSALVVGLIGSIPLARAMPPPPASLVGLGKSGPTNVKVRRITEVKPISTTAPPPAVALKGKHRLLVILVETADSRWPSHMGKSRYEEMLFARSTTSLAEFYRENSYGHYEVGGEVVGPVRVPGRMNDYAFEIGGSNKRVTKLIERAVTAASREVDFRKFDQYDIRGREGPDGVIDHLMVVYAEKTGKPQGFAPIWPHRGTTDIDLKNVRVGSYTVLNHGSPLGVFVHEFAHDIGLPDLYDRDYSSHGAGEWCLMASGSWVDGGARPAHISAWGKIRLGWIVPKVVAHDERGVRVPASSEKPFALKVPIGTIDSTEYFLVENRRRVGFDSGIAAEGVVIWHIDDSKGHNDDERRKMVDVVEAAQVQDLDHLDQGRLPDHRPDIFALGNKEVLDDDTDPSARTYSGQPSKIRIRIRSKAARVMKLDVHRPKIFNPGGIPYALERDGYRYGRFLTVPTGKGSEALVQLQATPGGYLIFGSEVFFAGRPNRRAKATISVYEDRGGKPGSTVVKKTVKVATAADGYAWVTTRLTNSERGVAVGALQKLWVGVALDTNDVAVALNPFSVSKTARFRRGRSKSLSKSFNFSDGVKPVADFVVRLRGFGFIKGEGRPEALATEEDELVQRMKKADQLADKQKLDPAMREYQAILAEMEKSPREYQSWIPVVVNSLGVVAYRAGRFEDAREQFQTSLRRAQAAKDQPNEADIFQNLCETDFHDKKVQDARRGCDRSKSLNEALGRQDRLVENFYWLGRSFQLGEGRDPEAAAAHFASARTAAEKAFSKERDVLASWNKRIDDALGGAPSDPDRVKERSETIIEDQDPKGPKQRAQYQDLLQFLSEDTEGQ